MLKLVSNILRNGILYHLKVSPHKIIINYREEKSNFTRQKSDRNHHRLAEGYMGVLVIFLQLICKSEIISKLKVKKEGFPGGTVVENLPANAGDTGSSPGLGRSHMPRSKWACEPQLLSLRVWTLCSTTGEATIVRGPHTAMKSGPRSPQLEESPHTETKTQ